MKGQEKLKALQQAVKTLPGKKVFVGIPSDHTARGGDEISNAQLGYIAEFGAPEANIPARPSLVPGIRSVQKAIEPHLLASAKAAVNGDTRKQNAELHAAGLVAVNGVRAYIRRGLQPPLAESTLRRRARRKAGKGHRINKGAAAELKARAQGVAASSTSAKPMIDSGQFIASITYVTR